MFEIYLDDPVLQSTFRLFREEGGVWGAWLADGSEFSGDALEDVQGQIVARWLQILKTRAGISA